MKTLRLFLITPHHNSLCFPPLDQKKNAVIMIYLPRNKEKKMRFFLKKLPLRGGGNLRKGNRR
jgi:hypothetical protein